MSDARILTSYLLIILTLRTPLHDIRANIYTWIVIVKTTRIKLQLQTNFTNFYICIVCRRNNIEKNISCYL